MPIRSWIFLLVSCILQNERNFWIVQFCSHVKLKFSGLGKFNPKGCYLHSFLRGQLGNTKYQISKLQILWLHWRSFQIIFQCKNLKVPRCNIKYQISKLGYYFFRGEGSRFPWYFNVKRNKSLSGGNFWKKRHQLCNFGSGPPGNYINQT